MIPASSNTQHVTCEERRRTKQRANARTAKELVKLGMCFSGQGHLVEGLTTLRQQILHRGEIIEPSSARERDSGTDGKKNPSLLLVLGESKPDKTTAMTFCKRAEHLEALSCVGV